MELLYLAYNRDQSEVYTLRNALNSEYDKLYSTAKDVLETKKQRLERQVEENAAKLAAKSIIDADKEQREKLRQEAKIRERAEEMVDEYKDEMSNSLYKAAKEKVKNTDIQEAIQDKPKRRIIRKNI